MPENSAKYEAIIGLEVHAQLNTDSKIFCSCNNEFGADANTHACPVCLGLPGVLPVLNHKVVEYAIKMGLATNCKISPLSIFARKNYFYPDLPKGYQISQYEAPLCEHGWLDISTGGQKRRISIRRIHLEEDAGKSVHDEAYVAKNASLIDLNRCGTPLIEIVSEPDFRSPDEASEYMKRLRQILLYLGICDGNMEEGSLRCDANISVKKQGSRELGTKTELKNMNSFRNVERALTYEIDRQISLLEKGDTIVQATLLWDADSNQVQIMRTKEEEHDYRYFPDPDLVPLIIEDSMIGDIKNQIPELPEAKKRRFIETLGIPEYDADILTATPEMAAYFETAVGCLNQPKLISNWLLGEVARFLNETKITIENLPVSAEKLAQLLKHVASKDISNSAAKQVFEHMISSDESAEALIDRLNLRQVSDSGMIEKIIDEIIAQNPNEVQAYKSGKAKLIGFFVGQVMRASKGQANPKVVNEILTRKLKN